MPFEADEGYVLIGVLVLVALLLIALAVAAPRVASDLQRDKEDELMHRGLQYAHAIRLYYKKFGRYPSNLDQLEKTNEIRFLRKRYKDPVTGKDEWRLIHLGEAKVKSTGLFGQPIASGAASALAAGAPAGTTPDGTTPSGIAGSSFGASAGVGGSFGSSAAGGSSFGSSAGAGSSFGSSGIGGSFGSSAGGAGIGASTQSSQTDATSGPPGSQSNAGGGAFGSQGGVGSGQTAINALGASDPGSANTLVRPTFGGGGIVGVSSTSIKVSIREFKKQKHYNEWEFVYDPLAEQNGQNGTGILQQPGASNPNTSIGAPSANPGIGSAGSMTAPPPTTTPTPQQ